MSAQMSCIGCEHNDSHYDLCNHPGADIIEVSDNNVPAGCPIKFRSRIVPSTEKTTPARLANVEGYRQILALKFAIGSRVRVKDEGESREVTSVEIDFTERVLYGLDFGDAIWIDEELEFVSEENGQEVIE